MKSQFKNVASQSFKVMLCLVMLFMFLVVSPLQKKQEVEAALPIVAWAGAVLGSMLLDTAIDMGVEFVDDTAKNKWKDKKVGELWNKYGEKIKDLKPTKKNLTKWALKAPKWLMAAIIDTVSDSIEDTIEDDTERKKRNQEGIKRTGISYDDTDPLYKTDVSVTLAVRSATQETRKLSGYIVEWTDIVITPNAYGQSSYISICPAGKSDYSDCWNESLVGDTDYYVSSNNDASLMAIYTDAGLTSMYRYERHTQDTSEHYKPYQAYLKYLTLLQNNNKTVYNGGGVLTTKSDKDYFDLPDTDDDGNEVVYSPEVLEKLDDSKYPMIKEKEFEFDFGDDSTVIDADYEVINEGDEVNWEIIEKDITNNTDNYNKVINYDYEPTINNYYEIVSKEDLEKDITIVIDNDIDIGNGVGSWSGEIEIEGPFYCVDKESKLPTSCKEVEAIDGSLLDYVANAYDYAVNAVKSAVNGLTTIATGATGLIALYSNIFDWLPDEVTVILTSGLLLMIGLRVFRK